MRPLDVTLRIALGLFGFAFGWLAATTMPTTYLHEEIVNGLCGGLIGLVLLGVVMGLCR